MGPRVHSDLISMTSKRRIDETSSGGYKPSLFGYLNVNLGLSYIIFSRGKAKTFYLYEFLENPYNSDII